LKIRNLAVAAVALVLPLVAASCASGSDPAKFDREKVVKSVTDGGNTKAQGECVADALKDASFTNDDIKKYQNKSIDTPAAKKDSRLQAYVKAVGDCVSGG